MDLADVMDQIGDRLDTIDGLRVYRYPPDKVTPPAAVVTYPDEYTYDSTYGRGMDRITLPVIVMVGRASDRASRDQLAAYVNGSGAQSIKALVEGDGSDAYLALTGASGSSISAPDRSTFAVSGDLWLAADVAMTDWTPSALQVLVAQYGPVFNVRAYRLGITSTGAPQATISSTGADDLTATGDPLGFTDDTRHAVGVEIVPDDGSGNRTFQFYTAPTLAGPWTEHGSLITQAGAVSISNAGTVLAVGADSQGNNHAAGRFYRAEVRSGGRTGAIVADPNFGQPVDTYAFLDSQQNPWTAGSAATYVAGVPNPYTAFDTARVEGAEFDLVSVAGVEHVAATLSIDIAGTGA